MKIKEQPQNSVHHNVIHTKHVFSVNNQVFIKELNADTALPAVETAEWFPVNFQWIPVIKLRKTMLSTSNEITSNQ
ncbi:hypothetical protein [Maribacter sp. 2-571]|uniref:hypothetical protein n=1 Tax=Maribacter sp. 2-571 TaxID=3417569 RepID=UPI003D34E412